MPQKNAGAVSSAPVFAASGTIVRTRCLAPGTGCITRRLAVFSAGGAASTVACVIARFSATYDTGKLARSAAVVSTVRLAGRHALRVTVIFASRTASTRAC